MLTTTIKSIKTTYHLRVENLSPIHIGNGQKLLKDIDFVVQGNCTYILDLNRFAEWAYTSQTSTQWMEMKPGEVLADMSLEGQPFVSYKLDDRPEGMELYTQLKDVYDGPYIPGSTLKGMLRTALLWTQYHIDQSQPPLEEIVNNKSKRESADDDIQREHLGKNANLDILRLFHFSDSSRVDQMDLSTVYTYNTNRHLAMDIETIPAGACWNTTLKIDEYLLEPERKSELEWTNKPSWEQACWDVLRDFFKFRVKQELRYWENQPALKGFYERLQSPLANNQFLAQIGWGNGWNSKTLNDLLLKQSEQFAKAVRKYKLQGDKSSSYQAKGLFPQTRHVVKKDNTPQSPLGWILITVD